MGARRSHPIRRSTRGCASSVEWSCARVGTARIPTSRVFDFGRLRDAPRSRGRVAGKMHRFLAMTVEEQEEGVTTRSLYETPELSYRVHVVEADGTSYFVPPLESSEALSVEASEAAVLWPDLWAEARRRGSFDGSSPGPSSEPTTSKGLVR